jgi:uncharacterized protein (DUF2252 family)
MSRPAQLHAHPHDEWCRPLAEVKAFPKHASLAVTQTMLDRTRLKTRPELLRRKWQRMTGSPLGFLRGAAPLFDECLRREGSWSKGPSGGGSLVGDLHLENFGVFLDTAGRANFHVNDFDALRDGPWRFDVLRLLTAVLLARTELKATGREIQKLAELVLDGHQAGLDGQRLVAPAFVREQLKTATLASTEKLLRKHMEGEALVRDEKHPAAPGGLVKQVPAALEQWAAKLTPRPTAAQLRVLDVRRRVLGTGSLGAERLMVLVQGTARGAATGHWLLDLKQVEGEAARVVEAMRAAVLRPPALFGSAQVGELEMLVRRLSAGDEKLDIDAVPPEQAEAVLRYLGGLAGEVHRRLARTPVKKWSAAECEGLLESARKLAAMHEEAFLEFCAIAHA